MESSSKKNQGTLTFHSIFLCGLPHQKTTLVNMFEVQFLTKPLHITLIYGPFRKTWAGVGVSYVNRINVRVHLHHYATSLDRELHKPH